MSFRDALICECGNHAFVGLTKGMVAFLDATDLPKVAGHLWCADARRGRAYAIRAVGPKKARRFIYMHREIAAAPAGADVDHWDHDGLNNRRQNLRTASRSLNNANQRARGGASPFKGVHFHKGTGKWHAQIRAGGVRRSLGLFATETDAARAYDAAATATFGAFAATNHTLGLLPGTEDA